MMRNRLTILALACGLMISPAVHAKDWTVDYSQSHLGFTGTQGSTSFTGGFKKFQASIDFDPAKPESGKISATIDMASAFTGSEDRDGALPGSDWFNTAKFPQAQFATTGIMTPDACNVETPADVTLVGCYKADATLTIKGISKPVTLAFYLTKKGENYDAKGEVKLSRTDFNVGQGQWSSEDYVKHAVVVTLDIAAHPSP